MAALADADVDAVITDAADAAVGASVTAGTRVTSEVVVVASPSSGTEERREDWRLREREEGGSTGEGGERVSRGGVVRDEVEAVARAAAAAAAADSAWAVARSLASNWGEDGVR